MTQVCVIGSVNIDLTCHLPRWPDQGETIAVLEYRQGLGGKGANQAVAAARLGAEVHFIGAVGNDSFGQTCRSELSKEGVASQLVDLSGHPTGMAVIDVGPDGNNIIRLAHGANFGWTSEMLNKHAAVIESSDVLLLQNEIPLAISMAAASIGRRSKTLVVMDPAPAPKTPWSSEIFHQIDILTPNAHEAGQILGIVPCTLTQARLAAAELVKLGPRGAVVTMGGDGVAWCIDGVPGQLIPPKVSTVDTVGAGDCFNGSFAASLTRGMSIACAIEIASTAAALATTQFGAAKSMPTKQDLETFMERKAIA